MEWTGQHRIKGKKVLCIAGICLVGALLGAFTCFWVCRALLLRSAMLVLTDYAQTLSDNADAVTHEFEFVARQLNATALPFCSETEISAMMAKTFRSRYLKDIGRTRDGKLYCSASLSLLGQPYVEGRATTVLASRTRVYTNVAVVIASTHGDHASVLELDGIDAVLNPAAFDQWKHPHTSYMLAVVEDKTGKISSLAGTTFALDADWVRSQGVETISGVLYRARCSRSQAICAITAESVADVWAGSRGVQSISILLGALIGSSMGLALALIGLRYRDLNHQLHRAIRRRSSKLHLLYQPIVEVTSGRCAGAEALIRWTDQDGNVIAPDFFVNLAEEKGYIGELTAFVVERAIEEMGPILREHREMTLAINVAASDIQGPELRLQLDKSLRQADVSPQQIILELTERSTGNMEAVREGISRLSLGGFEVHVDDFGTGFSSLSYINQLAVDAIKVDRSFTRVIGTDAVTSSILPQILAMAETLHVNVIVEGVETAAQLAFLKGNLKPLQAQGWFFSQPLSAEALYRFRVQSLTTPQDAPAVVEVISA